MNQTMTSEMDDIVAEVFNLMLALECSPVSESPAGSAAVFPTTRHSASVLFSGSLNGSCALQADPTAAASLTAHLTGVPAESLHPDLFPDTIAELCNMIAGCWKSRQPEALAGSTLSPPTPLVLPNAALYTFVRTYTFNMHRLTLAFSLR